MLPYIVAPHNTTTLQHYNTTKLKHYNALPQGEHHNRASRNGHAVPIGSQLCSPAELATADVSLARDVHARLALVLLFQICGTPANVAWIDLGTMPDFQLARDLFRPFLSPAVCSAATIRAQLPAVGLVSRLSF